MASSGPTSFLHLPPEIRNLVYNLAFNPNVKTNILDPAHSGYTRDVSPLLYVHPIISADLRQRTYGGDFSLVLPIQEPSEWVKGRLDGEKLKTCLDRLPDLMKNKCQRLIVEASQSDEDVDYEFWDSEEFPSYLVPLLLQIKEEIPTLKKITFIFWFGEWSAPVDVWQKSLRLLSRRWNKAQNQDKNAGTCRAKLSIEMQFNLFDYYDQDSGDGGANEYMMWYCFAGHERSRSGDEGGTDSDRDDENDDKSQESDEAISEDENETEGEDEAEDEAKDEDYSRFDATAKSLGLKFTFRAMDLHWDDHINGNFEGKEFDPNVWDDGYFHMMSPMQQDRAAHKYWHVTETCKPIFLEKVGG